MPSVYISEKQASASPFRWVWPFFALFAGVNVWAWQWPVFWDAILYARMGIFYQETNFQQLLLPAGLDAGHPPFFGLYLALVWEVLGRSLWAAHLAMLPFVLGTVWQLWRLVRQFFPAQAWFVPLLLLSLETTWFTTTASVSNEVVLVFGYLLALNAMLKQERAYLLTGLLLMAACSLRGIVGVGAIGLTELLWLFCFSDRKLNLRLLWPYAVAGLAILAWLVFHYQKTGWLVSTPAEGWVSQRQVLGPAGMLRNAAIIAWRMADFGRVFLWLAGLAAFWLLLKKRFGNWLPARKLTLMAAVPLVFYSLLLVPFSNAIGHRYLLVCYLLLGLLASWFLVMAWQGSKRWLITGLVALGLVSGHFWLYPDPMAKGWDAHLAHLPYFKLRDAAIAYLRQQNISPTKVGTYFPNEHGTQYSNLDGSTWKFRYKDLTQDQYVLISNVFNPPRPDLAELQSARWKRVKTWQQGAVHLQLFSRK